MSTSITKIILEKQEDGNWIGTTNKDGRDIQVRDIGPETVLQQILTHE